MEITGHIGGGGRGEVIIRRKKSVKTNRTGYCLKLMDVGAIITFIYLKVRDI